MHFKTEVYEGDRSISLEIGRLWIKKTFWGAIFVMWLGKKHRLRFNLRPDRHNGKTIYRNRYVETQHGGIGPYRLYRQGWKIRSLRP